MKRLLEKIRAILRNRRTRRVWVRIVSALACLVVFVATYALILPAITLEKTLACGMEEHQHTKECYEEELVCEIPESDGHEHDASCYRKKLVCGMEVHTHSAKCYAEINPKEEGPDDLIDGGPDAAADGTVDAAAVDGTVDAAADGTNSFYEESASGAVGSSEEEKDAGNSAGNTAGDGMGSTVGDAADNSSGDGTDSTAGVTADNSSGDDVDNTAGDTADNSSGDIADNNSEDTADNSSGDIGDPEGGSESTENDDSNSQSDSSMEASAAEAYVPDLAPLNMDAMLSSRTDFYYFHAEEGEEIPADSAQISDWVPADQDTVLEVTDLVKLYLAYTIPAGSLNETNPIARYRLPDNIHLTDDQINAINKNENGFYTVYANSDAGREAQDSDSYLGAEAVEGDRRPDEEIMEGAQEYISAVVRAENAYEGDEYLGQDLIFTFLPYSIEKNRVTYDADGNPLSAGEKITGWFACDFNMQQIDWLEEGIKQSEETDPAAAEESAAAADGAAADGASAETPDGAADQAAAEALAAEADGAASDTASADTADGAADQAASEGNVENTVLKTAKIIFAAEDREEGIEEISRTLRLAETVEADGSETAAGEGTSPDEESGDEAAKGTVSEDETLGKAAPEEVPDEIIEAAPSLDSVSDSRADSAADPYGIDGKSYAIVTRRQSSNNDNGKYYTLKDAANAQNNNRGNYMQATDVGTITVSDGIEYCSNTATTWKFEYVMTNDSGNFYRISTGGKYLYIDPALSHKSDTNANAPQNYNALHLESAAGDGSETDGTLIKVVQNSDGTYTLSNKNGLSLWNYGNSTYWLSTSGEESSLQNGAVHLMVPPEPPHVTVHYVLRDGTPVEGVEYSGTNTKIHAGTGTGTFIIPYAGNSANIDLSSTSEWNWGSNYTYANTHLNGQNASGTELKQNGYIIESVLYASSADLSYKSDSGETYVNPMYNPTGSVLGNVGYGSLTSFSLSGRVYTRPTDDGSILPYVLSNNKDIYVILDPLPTAASTPGGSPVTTLNPDAPTLAKTMESNGDGTYTLSLEVDAHAASATKSGKANVLLVVDTSSSMRNLTKTTNPKSNRIMDTHDAVLDLGETLLDHNGSDPSAVEVAMITFDGGVTERQDWTTSKTEFRNAVNTYLKYQYLHTGTDWEDALKEALNKLQSGIDDDPTFVIFFTDGEPSQYTNFHGAGTNNNADPVTGASSETISGSYPDFYSFFLSREASKDEMRAIVNEDARLYGIYAYNKIDSSIQPYNGEDGALLLHNAIKYGYNTDTDLRGSLFFEAENTSALNSAFDTILNSILETVGFTNVVVNDGIAADVTSSTVVEGDVSGFTYTINDDTGVLAYQVTVAPNGVPEGTSAADGTPIFTIGQNGGTFVGEVKSVATTKIKKDTEGNPILDSNGVIQTETVNVDVYYYKDAQNKEYIMPISTTGENIVWDLSPLGILKDGYSYKVSFVVWPNQDAYDLVADFNNGIKHGLQENWEGLPFLTDSSGRRYRKGGIEGHSYIALYEDGTYSAMSNTDQNINYYKADKIIEGGEEKTEYTGPFTTTVNPPDPMRLTASSSQIEKQWNVERDPGTLAQLLYNADGTPKKYKLTFDVLQGNSETPYTSVDMGWYEDPDHPGDSKYLWDENSEQTVIYNGHSCVIGTRWSADFSIATGLMLSGEQMDEQGLNKSLYPSGTYGGKTYYVLEEGHDYTIREPELTYEFDFDAPIYHPMLVDGVLQSVKFTKNGNTITITDMTSNETGLSGLKIENTLRGYINLDKNVVGEDGTTPAPEDSTKFTYFVELSNSTVPGPFTVAGSNIPWYGISGLYYHDADYNYYQAYEASDGWKLKNEDGDIYNITSTGFNPDLAEEQSVTYAVPGEGDTETSVTVGLFGNQMEWTSDNYVSVILKITQDQTLNIANIPVGTVYTITESQESGYELIKIEREIKLNPEAAAVESSQTFTGDALNGGEITGTIVENRDNHIIYTNKATTGGIKLKKEVTINGLDPSNETLMDNTLADGEYQFNIAGKEGTGTAGQSYTVKITIVNGQTSAATICDNTAASPQDTAAALTEGAVTLEGLLPGVYIITEAENAGTQCTAFSSTKASDLGDPDNRRIEVTVTPGINNAATITCINNYTERDTGIDIVKVDNSNRQTNLPGAKFTLTKLDEASTPNHIIYKKVTGSDTLEKQEESAATDDTGAVSFSGLKSGYYEIRETKIPDGYIQESDVVFYVKTLDGTASYLIVSEDETKTIAQWDSVTETSSGDLIQYTAGTADNPATNADETVNTQFEVGNEPGAELPSTGGAGTHLIYIAGLMLIVFAVAGILRRQFRNHHASSLANIMHGKALRYERHISAGN